MPRQHDLRRVLSALRFVQTVEKGGLMSALEFEKLASANQGFNRPLRSLESPLPSQRKTRWVGHLVFHLWDIFHVHARTGGPPSNRLTKTNYQDSSVEQYAYDPLSWIPGDRRNVSKRVAQSTQLEVECLRLCKASERGA